MKLDKLSHSLILNVIVRGEDAAPNHLNDKSGKIYLGLELSKYAYVLKVKHLRHDIMVSQVRQEVIQDPHELSEIFKLILCHGPTYSVKKTMHLLVIFVHNILALIGLALDNGQL